MAANRLKFSRTRAQGQTLLLVEVTGPDVVGRASVYLRPTDARRLWDLFGEEIVIAEAEEQ